MEVLILNRVKEFIWNEVLNKTTVSRNTQNLAPKWTMVQIRGGEGWEGNFEVSRHVLKQIAKAQKGYTRGGEYKFF